MKINKLLILVSTFISINSLAFMPTNPHDTLRSDKRMLRTSPEEDLSVFLVSSKEDLLEFIKNCSTDSFSKNNTFELTNDIDLQGELLKPIPVFSGTFNGNNHTIKNFIIDSKSAGNETGFIRLLTEEGSVNNLILESQMEVKNDSTSVGGFVGTNRGIISNCTYKGSIKGRHIIGGLVGENTSTGKIIDSINEGNIIGKMFTGGIVGFNKGTVTKCVNKGLINNIRFSSTDELTLSSIGGISGFNQYIINESSNYGEVGEKQIGELVGGISGTSVGQINNSNNYGEIKGDTNLGGIVGYYAEFKANEKDPTTAEIIELANKILGGKEKVNEPELKLGEIKTSSLKYCFNSGNVIGNTNIGGIVGYSSNPTSSLEKRVFDVNNCFNEGNITASKENLGGIVGNQLNGKIFECVNTGNIDGKTANYVGGIVGKSGGEVAYSFAINDMIGNMYVGGIGGENNKLHDCYIVSKIESKNAYIGALSGNINDINENIYNNYYVNDDYYGIDNIDFENKSTRITKEDLASKGELTINLNKSYFVSDEENRSYPKLKSFLDLDSNLLNNKLLKDKMNDATKFGSYVNFIDENGDIVKRILVEYNKDLDPKEIPEAPSKNGYFVKWSDFNAKNITKNLYIKPVYSSIITTIASEKGANPNVLVQGEFYETSKVDVNISFKDILDKKSKFTYIKTIKINLKDETNKVNKEGIKYKILLPSKYENINVATLKDDKLNILKTKIDGKYVVFDALEDDTYYLLDKKFANVNNPWFITTIVLSSIGGVLLIGGVVFGIIYYVKKKKPNKVVKHSKKDKRKK